MASMRGAESLLLQLSAALPSTDSSLYFSFLSCRVITRIEEPINMKHLEHACKVESIPQYM
jgi:hypothetical protein